MKTPTIVILFVVGLFSISLYHPGQAAPAEPAAPLTWLSSIGGAFRTVAVSDTLAYVGAGAAVLVLDVHQPSQPVELARLPLPDLVYDIQVAGSRLFVATGQSGVQVIDVSAPQTPTLLANYDTAGVAVRTYVADKVLYVADSDGGVVLLDISELAQIQALSVLKLAEFIQGVRLVKGLLYTWDLTWGLFIVDVSQPRQPLVLKSMALNLYDVAVAGDIAYFTQHAAVVTYDISQPSNPILLSTLNLGSPTKALLKQGLLYAINYSNLLVVDPAKTGPAAIIDEITIGHPIALWLENDLAFIVDADGELEIVSLSQPDQLTSVGKYGGLANVVAAAVVSPTVYLADVERGIHLIDIRDPANPALQQTISLRPGAYDLALQDRYLYAATGQTGLKVFDLTSTITPTLVYTYTYLPGAFQVEIQDKIAFVAAGSLIYIFDVSQPALPQLRSTVPCADACLMAVKLPYLYVSGEKGFQIFEIGEPYLPRRSGEYIIGDPALVKPSGLIVFGNYVYLPVGYNLFLDVVDVLSSENPKLVERLQIPAGPALQVDSYAFLTSGVGLRTLTVYQVAAANLRTRASFTLPSLAKDIIAVNNLLLVADGDAGLQILSFNPEQAAPAIYFPHIAR